MIAKKSSYLTRIFDDLVRNSRRARKVWRAPIKGGAELAVLVKDGSITLTIKRPNVPVGAKEIEVFREHCDVPADAEILTPPEQATRDVRAKVKDPVGGTRDVEITWYYVTLRWRLP